MEHRFSRRAFVAALAALPLAARAQAYPAKAVTIVVPSLPGGVLDVVARTLAPQMSDDLHQSVVVDNRPGGNSHIGASLVARSKPDGYTLLCAAGSTLVSGVSRNLNYEPMSDLVPVARVVTAPVYVVVSADSPFKTLADLIEASKSKPGTIFFGSTSVGNSTHIGAEMLNTLAGMGASHVPYKGAVPALTDLAGGRIHFMLDSLASVNPMLQSGKIRMLAVTAPARVKDFPNVPTVAETLPGFQIEGWVGVFAPAATPAEIVDKLAGAIEQATKNAEVAKTLRAASGEVAFLGPAEARIFMNEDHERIIKVVRAANIVID
ncbi:MAG: tripartite tricarboxylate transporter substrate binding protein [Pigmentiphaga sp.]|nr:tripartite tricarboxylate transporter substrate binding protein [Pigmentiphaga sp.]